MGTETEAFGSLLSGCYVKLSATLREVLPEAAVQRCYVPDCQTGKAV
jgi:hypothetical protein